MSEEDIFLNDVWSVYFHDPNNTNWTHSSYIHMGEISTVDDFWNHHKNYINHANKAMFFIMREHVFPSWDDPSNIRGGCLSIKVLKDEMPKFWEDLCIRTLGEDVLTDNVKDKWQLINGISTSPKKHFCIVKIWLQTTEDLANKKLFRIMNNYYGDILFKSNMDNISNDVNKNQEASA
jgi:hypothetical protein